MKLSEDCLNMNLMVLSVLTVDQNIVNVGSGENIKAVSEDVIDVALKGTWGFTEFKGHDEVFKQTVTGAHSSLSLLSFSHL